MTKTKNANIEHKLVYNLRNEDSCRKYGRLFDDSLISIKVRDVPEDLYTVRLDSTMAAKKKSEQRTTYFLLLLSIQYFSIKSSNLN